MDVQKILAQFAEDTAYSSKGHYKTADWLMASLSWLLIVPLIVTGFLLIFDPPILLQRIVSFLGFTFTMLAVTSVSANNRDKANKKIQQHMELGNQYLQLHKELKTILAGNGSIEISTVEDIRNRISVLDAKTSILRISLLGRFWSRLVINREMDLDWLYEILKSK